MEMEKVNRTPPAMVFTKTGSDDAVRRAFPQVMDLASRDYHVAGWIDEAGDRYSFLVRNDRMPVRAYGADGWPCYR
jgi:hypothetical protein